MAWHNSEPELKAQVLAAVGEYSDLHFRLDNDVAVIQGSFPVCDDDGELERFAMEIRFPEDFPRRLPEVREIGGRLPRDADRHVNGDGTACLLVPEEWFVRVGDKSFSAFLRGPVRNYFLGQALVMRGEPWPFGERRHGDAGALQAFEEILDVAGAPIVRAFLTQLTNHTVRGHWPCPCGSQEIIRRCHRDKIRELQKRIPPTIARQMLIRLGSIA